MPDKCAEAKNEAPLRTLAEQIREDVRSGSPEEKLQKLRTWVTRGKSENDKKKKIVILRETHDLVHKFIVDIEDEKARTSATETEKLAALQKSKNAYGTLNSEIFTERSKAQDIGDNVMMYSTEPVKRFGRADATTQMLIGSGIFAGLAAWLARGKNKFWAVLASLAAGVGLVGAARYLRQEKNKPEQLTIPPRPMSPEQEGKK